MKKLSPSNATHKYNEEHIAISLPKHPFCQNNLLTFLSFKNNSYSIELIVNYILYQKLLTASAKPPKNGNTLTTSCAPGVSFIFCLHSNWVLSWRILVYTFPWTCVLLWKNVLVFNVLENCVVFFADSEQMLAGKC